MFPNCFLFSNNEDNAGGMLVWVFALIRSGGEVEDRHNGKVPLARDPHAFLLPWYFLWLVSRTH